MNPRGPNENTKAIDVVKGGEISGSSVAISSNRIQALGASARAPRHRVDVTAAAMRQLAFKTSAIQRCTMRARLAPAQTSSISMMLAFFNTAARPGSVSTFGLAGMKLILFGAKSDCIAGLVA